MSGRYHIRTQLAAEKFPFLGKFSITRSDECCNCGICTQACIYEVHHRQEIDIRRLSEPGPSLCKNCFRCLQECPKDALSMSLNPAFRTMGRPYWIPDLISSLWQQADNGRIPVLGAGYRGPFTGEGFDGMWTDMSEIVRPTRDGIHGREYISTSLDIGRVPAFLRFDDRGRLVGTSDVGRRTSDDEELSLNGGLRPPREIPIPILFQVIPGMPLTTDIRLAIAEAAAELGTLAILPAKGLIGKPVFQGDHILARVGGDELNEPNSLRVIEPFLSQLAGVEIEGNPPGSQEQEIALQVRRIRVIHPRALVSVRLPLGEELEKHLPGLMAAGIDILHLWAGSDGREPGGRRRFLIEPLRAVHRALVEDLHRDGLTVVISGGIASAEHVPKAIICGADAVAIDYPLLVALGCRLCERCLPEHGVCPLEQSHADVPWGVRRIVNLMGAWRDQLLEVLGAMGMREVRRLRGDVGRALFFAELEREVFEPLFRRTSDVGRRRKGEENLNEQGNQQLSRSGDLAESDGTRQGNLYSDQALSERRDVSAHKSDAAGSSFHSGEHCGGTRSNRDTGISSSPIDSPRLTPGTGDSHSDLPESRLHESSTFSSASRTDCQPLDDDPGFNDQTEGEKNLISSDVRRPTSDAPWLPPPITPVQNPFGRPLSKFQVIRTDACMACGLCEALCPFGVHHRPDGYIHTLPPQDEYCIGFKCQENDFYCIDKCPTGALEMRLNPDFESLGDPRWTSDLIVATWEMAETGNTPRMNLEWRVGQSGGGFDRLRFVQEPQTRLELPIPPGGSLNLVELANRMAIDVQLNGGTADDPPAPPPLTFPAEARKIVARSEDRKSDERAPSSDVRRPTSDVSINTGIELNRRPFGPRIRIPIPWYGGGMSFGSVGLSTMVARAKAAKAWNTFVSTGEGGYPDELYPWDDHMITQVATGLFGVREDTIQRVRIVEMKYAQGAKPGLGGHLLADKNTPDVAQMRETVPGISLFSPFPFHSVYSVEDHKKHLDWIRSMNPNALISVKVSTPTDVDMVAVGSYYAGANILHLDGGYGGTGAAPEIAKKNIAMPIEYAIPKVHRFLLEEGIRDEMILIASGGLRSSYDIAKAIALGADGAVIGTADLVAIECVRCGNCESGRGCPRGIATTDPELVVLIEADWGAQRLINLYHAWWQQLIELLQVLGLPSIEALRGRTDLLEHLDYLEGGREGDL